MNSSGVANVGPATVTLRVGPFADSATTNVAIMARTVKLQSLWRMVPSEEPKLAYQLPQTT